MLRQHSFLDVFIVKWAYFQKKWIVPLRIINVLLNVELFIYCIFFLKKLTQNFKLLHVFTSSIFKVFINHSEMFYVFPQDRYVCAVTKDTLGNSGALCSS